MKYKIRLDQKIYEVEVEHGEAMLLSEYEAAAPAAPAAAQSSPQAAPSGGQAYAGDLAEGTVVPAPMPGTIVRINVTEGQSVAAGEVVAVLEAMKMENEITSAAAGTVAQIVVPVGTAVDTGAPIIVIA